MIVVRLFVLAVLGYVAWLLLRSIAGRKGTSATGGTSSGIRAETKVQDVLVEDPICHTLVPKNQAIRLRQDGTTYYFCSDACCDKFTGKAKGEK